MHILYVTFRVALEIVVLFVIADYVSMSLDKVKHLMPQSKGPERIAAFAVIALLIGCLVLRLYVFNPVV